jgi:hypothetical protein
MPSYAATSPASNVTAKDKCVSTRFPVPMFAPGEYPRKSQQAHSVLGMILLLMVLVWLMHITQCRTPLRSLDTAYKWSGSLQILLGAYLLCWCFVFLKPDHLDELFSYSTRDLLQIQHITISCCSICCGLIEYWFGMKKLTHQQWHVLWCINMCSIGMIFMVHPQPDFAGAATHTVLGMLIIFGAIFFLGEKWHQFPEDIYESWNVVLAGGLYLFASSLLIKYEEAPIVTHHGYNTYCHNGAPVTFACLIIAGISLCCILWFRFVPIRVTKACLNCIEAFHEDPYGACCQGKWNVTSDEVVVVDECGTSGTVEMMNQSRNGDERSYGEGDSLVPKAGVSGGSSSSSSGGGGEKSSCSSGRYSRVNGIY